MNLLRTIKFIAKPVWNDYPHNQACGASLRDKGGWIQGGMGDGINL